MATQFKQKHSGETNVAYALSLLKNSSERNQKWLQQGSKGNF